MNVHGEPDVIASCPFGNDGLGIFVAIEVKRPGFKPEPIQEARMERWRRAGAIAFWTDTGVDVISRIVNQIQQRTMETFLPSS
jgi:hypothetical protein